MISANKKYILFYIIYSSIIVFNSYSFSQNRLKEELKAQYKLATELYNKEEYFDAITELKRLLFFDKDNQYAYSANVLIGKSYKMGAKFSDAIRYFFIAGLHSSDINQLFDTKIEIIKINILRRTITRAFTLLDSLEKDRRFTGNKNEIIYWKGWAYIFDDKWDSAAEEFGKINSGRELQEISEKVENERYSVLKAKILSFIVPGAGQFYTGNYLSGILSLGWNILWGYITVNAFIENRIFDGIAVGELLWLRFYRGNVQNAEKFAEEKNREISNKALEYLQLKYKGKKP
jgi:TM2 domain-containing membrane protein YozV